jgi:hypothetical protein
MTTKIFNCLTNKEHNIPQIRCTHLRSVLRLSEEQGAHHSTNTMYSFTFRFTIVWRTRSTSFYKYDVLIYVLLVLQTIVKQNVNECIVFVEWCAPCSSDNLRTERKWVHRICRMLCSLEEQGAHHSTNTMYSFTFRFTIVWRTRSISFYKYDVLIYVLFYDCLKNKEHIILQIRCTHLRFVEWCAPCSSDNLKTERKWVHRICRMICSLFFRQS